MFSALKNVFRRHQTLKDALESKAARIDSVIGTGGFFGLKLTIQNMLSHTLRIFVNAGDTFLDRTEVFQRMTVLKEAKVELPPSDTKTVELDAFCMDASRPAPPDPNKRYEKVKELLKASPGLGLNTDDPEKIAILLGQLRDRIPQLTKLCPEAFFEPVYSLSSAPQEQHADIRRLLRGITKLQRNISRRVVRLFKECGWPVGPVDIFNSILDGPSEEQRLETFSRAVSECIGVSSIENRRWGRRGLFSAVTSIGAGSECKLSIGVVQHALWSITDDYGPSQLRGWVKRSYNAYKTTAEGASENVLLSLDECYDIARATTERVLDLAGLRKQAEKFRRDKQARKVRKVGKGGNESQI